MTPNGLGKLCEWFQRMRDKGRRERTIRFADDNSRYIASARRHCLLIFALGLVAAQLAWDESRYQTALGLYPYIEKVLKVVEAVREGNWVKSDLALRVSDFNVLPEGLEVLRVLAGDMVEMHEVQLVAQSSDLTTSTDPTNNCEPRVYRFVATTDTEERLALWVLVSLHAGMDLQAKLDETFLVWFRESCPELGDLHDPFVVVKYVATGPSEGVALTDGVLKRLGIDLLHSPSEIMSPTTANAYDEPVYDDWSEFGSAVAHLSDEQEARLREFDRKQLTTVDQTLLKGIVVSEARAVTHRNYQLGDIDGAFEAILGSRRGSRLDMWGLRLGPDLIPLAFPVALLSLAFSLLYRLRRIDPSRDVLGEPWVVFMPSYLVERAGATVWSTMPLAAAGGVIWATWVHHVAERTQAVARLDGIGGATGGVWQFVGWLAQTSLVWSLAAELVALLFLFQGAIRIRQIRFGGKKPEAE